MTPAEHYAEAERLVGEASNAVQELRLQVIEAAQVHATLATVGIITAAQVANAEAKRDDY